MTERNFMVKRLSPLEEAMLSGGWSSESYQQLNPDLADLSRVNLSVHFIFNGLEEGRPYSNAPLPDVRIDHLIRSKRFLLIYGWSSGDFDKLSVCGLRKADGSHVALIAETLRYWRNDVSTHLGTQIRTAMYGFIAICQIDESTFSDLPNLVVVAGGLAQRVDVPKIAKAEGLDLMLELYRLLESMMVYDELIYTLKKASNFVNALANCHRNELKLVDVQLAYEMNTSKKSTLSVCAVALGNAAQLKAWLMHLSGIRLSSEFEISILSNGMLEFDQILNTCRWAGEVLGCNIRLYTSKCNIGFNGGVNYLCTQATAPYILVTNTDVRYLTFDLKYLTELTKGKTLCVARQVNPMGAVQHEGLKVDWGRKIVHGHIVDSISTSLIGRNTISAPHEHYSDLTVDFFGAAAFLGSREYMCALGPFDAANLYAYHEDTELAARVRRNHGKIVVTDALNLIHYESSAVTIDLPKTFMVAFNTVRVGNLIEDVCPSPKKQNNTKRSILLPAPPPVSD